MKIKYIGDSPDADVSIKLVEDLVKEGIITDRETQIVGIYDNEILLTDIFPSELLVEIIDRYPDYQINTSPGETDPFKPEEGLTDVSKIGAVPDLTVQVDDDPQNGELGFSLSEIELFPETELGSGNVVKHNNNFSQEITMRKAKNFNDPTLDPNGVAKESKQAEVEATLREDSEEYTPEEGSFSGVDVTPFSDEEIERANELDVQVDGNEDIELFNEETEETEETGTEIEGETLETEYSDDTEDVEEIEQEADEMEESLRTFSARKTRLFSAKRRLSRLRRKMETRSSFAEDLSEKETSDIIEDIVAILSDAPEIKDAVMNEVSELMEDNREVSSEEVDIVEEEVPAAEEVIEEHIEDTETVTEPEGEVTEFSDDEIDSSVESQLDAIIDDNDDDDDSTEEIDETEDSEEISEPEDTDNDEYDSTEAGEMFCKAFSEDNVANYRRQVLAEMSKHTPQGRTIIR